MDIGSLLLILALLILVGLFVSRPFVERKTLERVIARTLAGERDNQEISTLLAERDRMINALQELDFDYTLGKIPEEDYPAQRSVLLHRGAAVLRKLDVLQVGPSGEDAESRLEAVIAARRADAQQAPTRTPTVSGIQGQPGNGAAAARIVDSDDEIEGLLAKRRRVRQEKAAGFCPKCGTPVQKSDRFCPKCGANLT